ncbi:MAG: AAA family ATPase [Clostridia bacterium]|nr:AAA family ATPase [Clostridia bacterium]
MDSQHLFVEKIEIEEFKKIRNLTIEPSKGANLLFGSFRSGKTSLCEFILFCLYGADSVAFARGNAEDALGRIYLNLDGRRLLLERRVTAGEEKASFVDLVNFCEVETGGETPGKYLTGLDQDSFSLITYFKQSRYETPLAKPKFSFLNHVASLRPETQSIYRDAMLAQEKKHRFRNNQGTGSLDLLLSEQAQLRNQLENQPKLEEEEKNCNASLSEISDKIDENDRRSVLIKADMAGFEDDLMLSRNKESAEDLHKSILAKEKEARILNYELTSKIGKLTPEELDTLKNDYNRLSLAVAALTEARLALSASEENLAFHQRLFTENESESYYFSEKAKIQKFRFWKTLMQIAGILLMAFGASLYFLLDYFKYSFIACLASGISVLLFGVATVCISTVFTGAIHKILDRNGKATLHEFNDFYDKVCAHAKTTQVYRDKVRFDEDICKRKSSEKDRAHDIIAQKVFSLGYTEEDGELLAICDEIIEGNENFFDLMAEIEEEKSRYDAILSKDVEGASRTVSPEFSALQKELAFLTAQNDSLYKKKALLRARLQEIHSVFSGDPEELQASLTSLEEAIAKENQAYEMASLNDALCSAQKENFENDLKLLLSEKINQKLSFLLGEGESYLFDEAFELCFCDKKSILPLISLGGGVVAELGFLVFRLTLAEILQKNHLPMIFDDSFATLSMESASEVYKIISSSCNQFFVATSSEDMVSLCRETATVFVL